MFLFLIPLVEDLSLVALLVLYLLEDLLLAFLSMHIAKLLHDLMTVLKVLHHLELGWFCLYIALLLLSLDSLLKLECDVFLLNLTNIGRTEHLLDFILEAYSQCLGQFILIFDMLECLYLASLLIRAVDWQVRLILMSELVLILLSMLNEVLQVVTLVCFK